MTIMMTRRQTDRQTYTQTDIQTNRHRHSHKHQQTQTDQTDRQKEPPLCSTSVHESFAINIIAHLSLNPKRMSLPIGRSRRGVQYV